LSDVRAQAREIHEALDRSDAILGEGEWAYVRENRDWAAQVYAALAGPEEEPDAESIAAIVANDVRGQEEAEIGEAFASLVGALPDGLRQWETLFKGVKLADRSRRDFLKRSISVASAGSAAEGILDYGIAPVMVFGATRGLQLQFDSVARRVRAEAAPDAQLIAYLELPKRRAPISVPEAVAAVAGTPGLPENTERPLMLWLLAATTVRPWLIGGYRAEFKPNKTFSFTPDSKWDPSNIVRRWSATD
jgi:hypothetical protein